MPVQLNPQPVDMIGEYCERLPVGEVTELQFAHNVNISGDCEEWFDDETRPADFGMTVINADDLSLFFPHEVK